MPIYVYRNLVTNETFEVEQRITEDALTTDPKTGDPVKRLIQPVGIAFKGSGFYINDSRGSKSGGLKSPSTTAATGDAGTNGSAGGDGAKSAAGDAKPSSTSSTTSTTSSGSTSTTTSAAG